MARRLLSHLLISLAVLSLTAMFFVWFIDGVLLNPSKLVPALKDSGALSAIATIIPEKATQDAKPSEKADMKAKIATVITPKYVEKKLTSISISVTDFMRNGSPQPVLDLKDFPEQLKASGIEVSSDISKNFDKPVELNKDGKLDKVPQIYKNFKLVKYLGLLLFVILLLAEWRVAARGEKLKRTGRIFMYTSFWFIVYWILVIFVPSRLTPIIKGKIADASTNTLVDSIVKTIQKLFGSYILTFAVICGIIALILYLLRHGRRHVNIIQDVPTAKIRNQKVVSR